jgi:hypothetical protein
MAQSKEPNPSSARDRLLEKLKSIDPAVLTELSFSTRRTATTPDVSGFADGFHDHFHDHVEKEM